jgi:hypothetical protein
MHTTLGVGVRPAVPRARSRTTLTIVALVPSSRHCTQYSETVLLGSRACGRLSHGQPLQFREHSVCRTSRRWTFRGRPPHGLRLADGDQRCHNRPLLLRQIGWIFLLYVTAPYTIGAHSSAARICAHYRLNRLFCQAMFLDSLSVRITGKGPREAAAPPPTQSQGDCLVHRPRPGPGLGPRDPQCLEATQA